MPLRDAAPAGAPCWIDLMTSDAAKSQAFYRELFGWTCETAGPEYGGYFNFSKDGVLVAGGMASMPGAQPSDIWSVYLAVEDAKAAASTAVAAGSTAIVDAMDVGSLGTMALVTDPGGAAIGMWQPAEHRGFGVLGEPGTPYWFELHTSRYDATVEFYREVFGWDTHEQSDVPSGFRYTTLGDGDGALAGIMDTGAYAADHSPGRWSIYFRVDDVDKALLKATELGATTVHPAEDTPFGRLADATDPNGALFKLHS